MVLTIGLDVQYLAPHNRQRNPGATTMLVRGKDCHGRFGTDAPPRSDFEPTAVAAWRDLDAAMKTRFQTK